jgi:isoaspartyl peptidase/L-asparaginase-like protein (Ntn-hydrolase superfamily)
VPSAILKVGAVTAIDTRAEPVTVSAALPETEPQMLATAQVAVTVALPALRPVASPRLLRVATAESDKDQRTSAVKFWVVWLEKVPVAVNAWVVPAASPGEAGLTSIATRVAAVTVSLVVALWP